MARKYSKKDFPLIEKEKLVDYAAERSGVDRRLALAVIESYTDGIYHTLLTGTQVAIPFVGVLTFKVHEPRPEGMYWNGFAKEYQLFSNRQGYYYLDIAPYRDFTKALKGATLFGESSTLEEYNEALIARHGERARPKKVMPNDE